MNVQEICVRKVLPSIGASHSSQRPVTQCSITLVAKHVAPEISLMILSLASTFGIQSEVLLKQQNDMRNSDKKIKNKKLRKTKKKKRKKE